MISLGHGMLGRLDNDLDKKAITMLSKKKPNTNIAGEPLSQP
jgi:hypothetical protein